MSWCVSLGVQVPLHHHQHTSWLCQDCHAAASSPCLVLSHACVWHVHAPRWQVVHDFEHGGLTNDFLVNTLDRLAVRYNDRSPLENHHLAAAFTLMQQPDFHYLSGLPKAEFDRFRKVGCAGDWCCLGLRDWLCQWAGVA